MRTFAVDRSEAKLMGVCAGLARITNVDATIIRIGFVVATLIGGWPWTLIAYVALGVIGNNKLRQRVGSSRNERTESLDYRSSERERRMAEIEAYTSTNDRLAREIEELR
jgi:phage shock protein C